MNNAHAAILALAQRNAKEKITDEFSTPEMTAGMSSEIQVALKELQAEEAKDAVKAAAKEIMVITRRANEREEKIIADIRALRRKIKMEEDELQTQLANLRTARTYAYSSSNYFPLMASLGSYMFDRQLMQDNPELFRIPVPMPEVEKKAETSSPARRKTAGK